MNDFTPITKCRTCQAEIRFLRTRLGRSIPVNFESMKPGDTEFDHTRHVSHYATCPQANEWRRAKRAPENK